MLKQDFIAAWSDETGQHAGEVKARVRVLYLAGLLPSRHTGDARAPLTAANLATAVLGVLAAAQHLDAPDATRTIAAARCLESSDPNGDPFGLGGLTAAEVLEMSFRGDFQVLGLRVNQTFGTVEMTIGQGAILTPGEPGWAWAGGIGPVVAVFLPAAGAGLPKPPGRSPLGYLCEASYPALARIAALAPATPQPATPQPARSVRRRAPQPAPSARRRAPPPCASSAAGAA